MPGTDDKIYGPNKIDEVIITDKNMKRKRYLDLPGELYYHNIPLFREAMKYMRQIGDKKAEQQLFLKRMQYGSNESAKGIFMLIGGTVGTVFTVGVVAPAMASSPMALSVAAKIGRFAKPTWDIYTTSTVTRMGLNATLQGATHESGWRGIDVISIGSEVIPLRGAWGWSAFGANALTPIIEYRPFLPDSDERIKTFADKSLSELVFDISTQGILSLPNSKATNGIKALILRNTEPVTLKGLYHFAYPTMYGSYYFNSQLIRDKLKQNIVDDGK